MTSERNLAPLGEFGRIARYFRPLAQGFAGALDLADDAAILAVPSGMELVVTTDAIVSGVHFLPDDAPADIARKALRVNLSDLAAKGATPLAYTLTLALGHEIDDRWVEAFAAGLAVDQGEFVITLAGGDSVSTGGPIWVSITAFGLVGAGRMVRRGGARPGDALFVTGTLGDSALGLGALRGAVAVDSVDRAYLADRYRIPQPRNAMAPAIAAHATAALDISDGFAADCGHLCRACGLDAEIRVRDLPVSAAVSRILSSTPDLWSSVLAGGDDYEVLFAAPPEAAAALSIVASACRVRLSRIGSLVAGQGRATLLDQADAPITLDRLGWTHS
jgi:thiamine-monophosphate kinase